MEHRFERRVPLDTRVLLWGRDRLVTTGRIRNANSEGMLIECDGKPFVKGESITLELPGGLKTPSVQMLGIVVHSGRRRLGVMIAPVPDGLLRQLRKCAEAAKSAERHRTDREVAQLLSMKS